jgi:glucokinase
MNVLAGDIGGTHARLAIVDIDSEGVRVLQERSFSSESFSGLPAIVRLFLTDFASRPDHACFGIPCPVADGRCVGTNLSWTIDARSLSSEIGIADVTLINDLHAVGEALQRLSREDLVTLQAGEPASHGVKAIIGAGTGLGQAFLAWTGNEYLVHDSEGGHGSFSPRNLEERRLLETLATKFGHVSRERIVSGPGLVNIYRHLAARFGERENGNIRAEMDRGDPAAVIGRHGLAGSDSLTARALDMFVSAYGAQAGNLALTVMAKGGVYLAGGIAPQILPKLRDGTFMSAFLEKGRLSSVLARVPVHVIVNTHVGVIGAACVAWRHSHSQNGESIAQPASEYCV